MSDVCPIPEWLVDGEFHYNSCSITCTRPLSGSAAFVSCSVQATREVSLAILEWYKRVCVQDVGSFELRVAMPPVTLMSIGSTAARRAVEIAWEPTVTIRFTVYRRDLIELVWRFNEWLVRRSFRREEQKRA